MTSYARRMVVDIPVERAGVLEAAMSRHWLAVSDVRTVEDPTQMTGRRSLRPAFPPERPPHWNDVVSREAIAQVGVIMSRRVFPPASRSMPGFAFDSP